MRTKTLDREFERGRRDGLDGQRPDCMMRPRWERIAYDAGYKRGIEDRERAFRDDRTAKRL